MVSDNPKTSVYDEERLLRRIEELSERADQLERDLARSHRLAMLGTLVGTIAHEFNNLLTPMMSYAQLALHDLDDKDLVCKALEKSLNTTDKAANITSALLGFTREGSNDTSCDVQHALDEALSCMARTPDKDGIRCAYKVDAGSMVSIQPIALQQVFLNLLLNACNAMRPSSGDLVIQALRSTWNTGSAEQGGGGCIEIRVQDTGHGMRPEIAEKIFEPFYSGTGDDEMPEGSGLGLTICKRLIEDAGGTISVQSTLGEGTTFTIRLPEVVGGQQHNSGSEPGPDQAAA